jgi:uncharacterized protein
MLQGENLVGRFCFKADRATSTLKVNASHHENGVDAALIAEAAHAELLKMANWLGMEKLDIAQRGNWARALTQVL